MNSIRCTLTLLLSCLVYIHSFAAGIFPRGCEVIGFGYDKDQLILNENGEQSYYLIQNRSDKLIELQRIETHDVFMSPPLTTKLNPTNWAAFASDVQNSRFQCLVSEEQNTNIINCQDILEVCQYPRVKFALSNMGNYWVSSNKAQRDIINDSTAKGIYLRW